MKAKTIIFWGALMALVAFALVLFRWPAPDTLSDRSAAESTAPVAAPAVPVAESPAVSAAPDIRDPDREAPLRESIGSAESAPPPEEGEPGVVLLNSASASGRDLAWAEARQAAMHALIREDPRQALATALSPRQYALLPAHLQARVEKPLAIEGFYGVLAVCTHGPDEAHVESCAFQHEVITGFGTFDGQAYPASIYGARHQRLSEENASLYGVILDGHIALHEDDVVVIDDGEHFPGGRYAVYYRGQEWTADDLSEVEAIKSRLSTSSH